MTYAAQPLIADDDELALLVTDPDGAQLLGTSGGLVPVADAGRSRPTEAAPSPS